MSRRTTIVSPLVLALFVMAGFQAAWGMALGLGYRTVSRALEVYPGHLRVDPTGRLLIENQRQEEIEYRTIDGRPVDVPEYPYWLAGASLSAPLTEAQRDRRLSWKERVNHAAPTRPGVSWYLVQSATSGGTGYFVGYSELSKMTVGYIGRSGFRTVEPPPDQWFEIAGPASRHSAWRGATVQKTSGNASSYEYLGLQGVVYLAADGSVWQIDLTSRTVETLSDLQDAASVAKSSAVQELPVDQVPDDWRGGPYYALSAAGLLVRTPTEVIGIDFAGRRRNSWPVPPKLRTVDFSWYELTDGNALASELHMDENVYWMQYQWIDRAGNVTREEEVFLTPRPPASQPYWMFAVVAPQVGLASLIEAVIMPISAVARGFQPDYPAALAQSLADGWAALLTVYSMSVLLAVLAYRRQTRFALPGAGAWAAFVFLFGAPGWLAYRCHRHWPVLEACGECRRPAPRDRESCAACGSVFAPPPPTGVEIFA